MAFIGARAALGCGVLALIGFMPPARLAAADAGGGLAAAPLPLFDLTITRGLLDDLLSTPPFDLWRDPRARAAVSEGSRQCLRWSDVADVPLSALIADARMVRVLGIADEREAGVNFRLDAGATSAVVEQRLWPVRSASDPDHPDPPATVDDIRGHQAPDTFHGCNQTSLYAALPQFLALLRPDPLPDAPHYHFFADYTTYARWLVTLSESCGQGSGTAAQVAALMPDFQTCQPHLTITATSGAAAWQDQATLTGYGRLPLHVLDARLASAYQDRQQVTVALAPSPALIAAFADEDWPLGAQLAHLLQHQSTGDVLVQGGWNAGILPDWSAVALLVAPQRCITEVNSVAALVHGTPTSLAGAAVAWNLPSSIGELTLAVVGERLVLASSDALASTVGCTQHAPASAPWAMGTAAIISVDLPAIASRWLPFAYQMVPAEPITISRDPLLPLTAIATLRGPPDYLRRMLALELEGSAEMRALFPGRNFESALASLGIYRPDPTLPQVAGHVAEDRVRMVLRTEQGYAIFHATGARERNLPLSQAQHALDGYVLSDGVALAQLPVLRLHPPAEWSRGWLPPLAVTEDHLRPYDFELRIHGGTLDAHEQGLPILPVLALMLGTIQTDLLRMDLAIKHQHLIMLRHQAARPQPAPPGPKPGPAPADGY